MDFVFRIPLLEFDICNEQEVQDNYSYVLKAIRVSSPSFFEIIKTRSYSDLTKSEKRSIYKYLLRGRYRPVPFGLWAGVGTGHWGNENKITDGEKILISHSISKVDVIDSNSIKIKYKLALNAVLVKGTIFYWVFDSPSMEWKETGLETNNIILKVYDYLCKHHRIDFAIYFSWFQGIEEGLVQDSWESLLDSDLLVADNNEIISLHRQLSLDQLNEAEFEKIPLERSVMDTHLKSSVSLDHKVVRSLQVINEEMGNLFHVRHSSYLEEFKKLFHIQHDDRFIKLDELLMPFTPLNAHLKNSKWRSDFSLPDTAPDFVFHHIRTEGNNKGIDLSTKIKHKPLTVSPETTAVFRLAEGDNILLDHLSSGKSFDFAGRFSLDRDHKAYYQKLKKENYGDENIIYADFDLFETPLINQLSIHENLFEHTIDTLGNYEKGSVLKLKDIYIGVAGGEVILYNPDMGKRVVPVVQHPVDPVHISHPLCRLLWEIAHQSVHSLNIQRYQPNPAVPYIPRLSWGKLILKPASWYVSFRDKPSVEQLMESMLMLGIPRFCLLGEGDRELLLDREDHASMDLLLEELRKKRSLILKECVWIGNSSFKSENSQSLYPQFITHLPQEGYETKAINSFFNPKVNEDPEWISCKAYLSVEDAISFLTKELPAFINHISDNMLRWYYLSYFDTSYHIKIRIKVKDQGFKAGIEKELLYFLSHSSLVQSFNLNPYFPEIAKYGEESRWVSEDLFCLESDLNIGRQGGLMPMLKMGNGDLYLFLSLWGATLLLGNNWDRKWTEVYDQSFHQITPKEDRKVMGRFYSQYIRDKPLDGNLKSFISQYRNLMAEHEYVLDPERSMVLFENHLHMAVNRLFPQNPTEIEPYIRFAVYRKIQEHRCKKTVLQMAVK